VEVDGEGTAYSLIHDLQRPGKLIKLLSAAFLYIPPRRAFTMETSDTSDTLSEVVFTQWCEKMCLAHPMFSCAFI